MIYIKGLRFWIMRLPAELYKILTLFTGNVGETAVKCAQHAGKAVKTPFVNPRRGAGVNPYLITFSSLYARRRLLYKCASIYEANTLPAPVRPGNAQRPREALAWRL